MIKIMNMKYYKFHTNESKSLEYNPGRTPNMVLVYGVLQQAEQKLTRWKVKKYLNDNGDLNGG